MSLVSKPPAMVEAESLDMHPTWNEKQYIWDAASLTVSPAGEALSKGPNKRTPRGPLVCRIDKCRAPLADATAACQRNRVCKFHLEQPELDINGVLSRFCQQCGKFQHAYERFDGSNRSCRACLAARRAERRRKALAKQNLEADGSSGEQSSGEPFRTASG